MDANEKKIKSVSAIINGKMDAYGVTKKTLYSLLGILGCLALTIVMSITGIGFNPDVFYTWNYWTGMLIQFSIAIFSMVTGRKIGDDRQRNSKDGQYRVELSNYAKQYKRIEEKKLEMHFQDWLDIYRKKKTASNIKGALIEFNIQQEEVLDLDINEVDSLSHPYLKKWDDTQFYEKYYNKEKDVSETKFMSLSKKQIQAVKAIKQGASVASYVSASYFLNALKGTSIDEWENAANSDKKKGGKLALGYSFRLLMIALFSFVLQGITTQAYGENGELALNIVMRIFVLISSVLWGIYLGIEGVDTDTVLLEYKTLMIKQCADEFEEGVFVPETIQHKAERLYDEHEQSVAGGAV